MKNENEPKAEDSSEKSSTKAIQSKWSEIPSSVLLDDDQFKYDVDFHDILISSLFQ